MPRMLRVDWGNLTPSREERAGVEARLSVAPDLADSTVSLRQHRSGFEASLRVEKTEVRLHDVDLDAALDRLLFLLDVVARERMH